MPKTRKTATPKCSICTEPMRLRSVIPKAWKFPELRTFECAGCGSRRTVEDETESAVAEVARAAA